MNKILIVVPIYGSYRVFLAGLAKFLLASDWEVHVACAPDVDGFPESESEISFHSLELPRDGALRKIWAAKKHLQGLIQEIQPTAVHAHFSVAVLCLALCRKVHGCRYLGTFQGLRFPMSSGVRGLLFKIVECYSITRMCGSWVLTEDDYLAVPSALRSRLRIQQGCGFGCDIDRYIPSSPARKRELRRKLKIPEHAFVFVFLGRLTAFKGFHLILDAYDMITPREHETRLLVVGDSDIQHPLHVGDLSSRSGVQAVGWQDDPEPYLAVSDVMVFPSEREGMPVCVMEALSIGLPVIGCDRRGIRELVKHEGTGLIANRDAESISGAMERLMTEPELHAKLSAGALQLREQLDRRNFYRAVESALI